MNVGNTKKRKTKNFTDAIPKAKDGSILASVLKGYLFSLLIGVGITLLFSAVIYSLSDPCRYITPVSFCILYISAFLGGFLSASIHRGSALLCGALYAAFMLGTMLIVSLLFNGSYATDHSLPLAVGLRGIAAALAIVGAMIATHKRPKKRKRK